MHISSSLHVSSGSELEGCSFSFEPCISRTLDQIPLESSCMANGMDHDGNELTLRSAINKARRPTVEPSASHLDRINGYSRH